jgi:hypothetical protein
MTRDEIIQAMAEIAAGASMPESPVACPDCGNRDIDTLVWDGISLEEGLTFEETVESLQKVDIDGYVTCLPCGRRFRPAEVTGYAN